MTNIDLQTFYNEWHSGKRTIAEIAAVIYRNSEVSSILRHYNTSVFGRDVKDDIAKLVVLLTAYFDRVAVETDGKIDKITSLGDMVTKAYEAILDNKRIIDLRPLLSYDNVESMKSDGQHLESGMVVRTRGYYFAYNGGGAEYELSNTWQRAQDEVISYHGKILYAHIRGTYHTPEQFGARGNGVDDDSAAFKRAFDLLSDKDVHLTNGRTYLITNPVRIERPVRLIGALNATIKFSGAGCFVISNPNYDFTREYELGDYCIGGPELDQNAIYKRNSINGWDLASRSITDTKGSLYSGNHSIFDSVIFGYCNKCFSGDLTYLTFNQCKFYHCNTIFYCESEDAAKKAGWFGKIDFTDCEFWYNREIFYLSKTNFGGYTLSLNAVTFTGGVINTSNVFCQYKDHNYNNLFRVESMLLTGVDIEKTDFYSAFNNDEDAGGLQWPTTEGYPMTASTIPPKVKWIGGLYIFNLMFQACHIEQFVFLHHGYIPYKNGDSSTYTRGLIRSQVIFENCFMQLSGTRRLIECDDVKNSAEGGMYLSTYSEVCFLVTIKDCPMVVTARSKEYNGYTEVVLPDITTGINPQEECWYKSIKDEVTDEYTYALTTDTEVQSGTTYYSRKSIGTKNYLVDQTIMPLIKMNHSDYRVIFDTYRNNIILNNFSGALPSKTTSGQTIIDSVTNVSYSNIGIIYLWYLNTAKGIRMDSKAVYEIAGILSNSTSSPKIIGLTGADSFSSDLGSSYGNNWLDNKNNSQIITALNDITVENQHKILSRFISILNSTYTKIVDGEEIIVYNVNDASEYISSTNVNDFIAAGYVTIDMFTSMKHHQIMYNGIVPQYIGVPYKLDTTFVAAKTMNSFLSALPNGSLVYFSGANYNSEVYYVINNNNSVQVMNVANAKDHLYYTEIKNSSVTNSDGSTRSDWQDCVKLKRIDISFTPSSGSMPSDLFNGCTSLTDIYVPWNEGLVSGAPWTDKRPVRVHYAATHHDFT